MRDVVWNEISTLLDLAEELWHLIIVEWERATYHGIKDDTTGPYVNLSSGIAHSADDLRCCVIWRSARSFEGQTISHDVGETKINEPDI